MYECNCADPSCCCDKVRELARCLERIATYEEGWPNIGLDGEDAKILIKSAKSALAAVRENDDAT